MVKTVKLEKIVCEDNRKYTKEDGFEQLVGSIRKHGVIEQPVVRALGDGRYKIIAGRRRIAAMRRLEMTETECAVYAADDPASDEEIALAENVNRLDMHPLDEAALFSSMSAKGMTAEEIARYYARSPSAVYKRLRLASLCGELKGMFRDGGLNIAGAAVLAELPEDDQKEFFKLYGRKDDDEDDEVEAVGSHVIHQFVYRKQKHTVDKGMKGCEGCAKRTHNENNALFEEYEYMTDVCLDADCYRVKWHEKIRTALEAVIVQMDEAGIKTDDKIFFMGGAPEEIYRKANKARFDIGKQTVEFEVLRDREYEITGETNRKKDACWLVHTGTLPRDDNGSVISVQRVGYKARPPKEKPAKGTGEGSVRREKKYDEAMEAAARELKMPGAESLEKAFESNNYNYLMFEDDVSDRVKERIIAVKVENDEPRKDYLEMVLEKIEDDVYVQHTFEDKKLSEQQKKWIRHLFGDKINDIKEISEKLPDEAHRFFHFMLLTIGFDDVPTLEDLKNPDKNYLKRDLFWRYADMGVDEYGELYLRTAKEVAEKALEPKGKKNAKKKTSGKTAAEKSKEMKDKFEPEEEEEDNYPFEPDAGGDDPEAGDEFDGE